MKNEIEELVNELGEWHHNYSLERDPDENSLDLIQKAIRFLKSLAPSDNAELVDSLSSVIRQFEATRIHHEPAGVSEFDVCELFRKAIAALSKPAQPEKFDVLQHLRDGGDLIDEDGFVYTLVGGKLSMKKPDESGVPPETTFYTMDEFECRHFLYDIIAESKFDIYTPEPEQTIAEIIEDARIEVMSILGESKYSDDKCSLDKFTAALDAFEALTNE